MCVDWMDAKGKKDIIDNMHEHKSRVHEKGSYITSLDNHEVPEL